jgi:hypothetical protein
MLQPPADHLVSLSVAASLQASSSISDLPSGNGKTYIQLHAKMEEPQKLHLSTSRVILITIGASLLEKPKTDLRLDAITWTVYCL